MSITDILTAEHAAFRTVFDQIERLLPGLRTLPEVGLLADLVEGLLRGHGEAEANLVYVALDHALEHKGRLDRLFEDHREIDAQLGRVRIARTVAEARRRLQAVAQASRDHFEREEAAIFPLIDGALSTDALKELGDAWLQRRNAPAEVHLAAA